MSKTALFQRTQFSINTQFKCKNSKLSKPRWSSIWPIDNTLSGVTTLSQPGSGSDDSDWVFSIPQRSSNTRTSPSDCLVSYPLHSLGGVLSLCRDADGVFYSTSRLVTSLSEMVDICNSLLRSLHQWKVDWRKSHYTKNSEYETAEISVPFHEKIFKIRKRKSKAPPDSYPPKRNQNNQKAVKKIRKSRKRKCAEKNKTKNAKKPTKN